MGRYVTIYRWKPATAMAFAKKWFKFVPGIPGPQKLKDAAAKFKQVSLSYSAVNSCIVFTYDLADEDWPEANMCATFLSDVCTMETFPVLSDVDQGKANDLFGDVFPEIMDEWTKE